MQNVTQKLISTIFTTAILLTAATSVAADELKRTSKGLPDLTGSYDGSSLTPLNRRKEFGDKAYLTRAEADAIAARAAAEFAETDSDPNRGAPQKGGDGRHQAYRSVRCRSHTHKVSRSGNRIEYGQLRGRHHHQGDDRPSPGGTRYATDLAEL